MASASRDSTQAALDLVRQSFRSDLQLVWDVHCYVHNSPPLRSMMRRVVSAHPLADISLATWCIFIAYVYDLGKLPRFSWFRRPLGIWKCAVVERSSHQ
jgi:hypothetical protein